MASRRFRLDVNDDVKKILKGALIAVAGALLTYLADQVVPSLENSGDGVKLTVAAVVMVLINAARKWLFDTRPTVSEAHALLAKAKPDPTIKI